MKSNRFEIGKKYMFVGETLKSYPVLENKIFTFIGIIYLMFSQDRYEFRDQTGGKLTVRVYHPILNDLVPCEKEKLKEFIRCLK